jgi:predicted permease
MRKAHSSRRRARAISESPPSPEERSGRGESKRITHLYHKLFFPITIPSLMTIFLQLFSKMLPIYLTIFLGFIAARFFGVKKEHIAKLVIYILLPLVSLQGVLTAPVTLQLLSLPLIAFLLCTVVCCSLYYFGSYIWKDATKNVLSVGIANGNFGFIGIPLVVTLLGNTYLPHVVLFGLGGALFISTVGVYLTARGRFSVKESIIKVLTIPSVYALAFGLLVKILSPELGLLIDQGLTGFSTAYSILGLMLVGIVVSEIKRSELDWKLLLFSLFGVFVWWPLLTFGFVLIDRQLLHFYSEGIYRLLFLMSVVPVGASIVGFATELKVEPDKASFAVVFTTLVSMIYIPVFLAVFL